jgi:uncharacterized repeat protein (TIGR03803 family)
MMKLAKHKSIIGMALSIALALAPSATAQTQTLTVLHNFTNFPDGGRPLGRLLLDPAGNLYGTTTIGGKIGYGSVFKVDTSGNLSIFYSFAGPPDGNEPVAGLIRDAAGNLYGTTGVGGTTTLCGTDQTSLAGCGIVFKLDPSGTETVLHRFGSNGPDGAFPNGPLALDSSGTLWGSTQEGGERGCTVPIPPNGRMVDVGCGTVFKVDLGGNETVVHNFLKVDGAAPIGGVIQDQAGNLYGVTLSGGLQNCPSAFFGSCGTVFKVDTSGQLSTFYSFKGGDGGPDGDIPESSLILDPAGNLYGTTNAGGTVVCAPQVLPGITCGTLFQLTPAGKETVLHSFGGSGDAGYPITGLVRDAAGNFYGLISGLVIKLDSMGKESVLYTFTGLDIIASGDLVQDAAGNLYGTTLFGANGEGTVFKLTTPPDFAVAAVTLAPATVSAGGSASSPVDLITVSGFNDTVTFACSVTPTSAQAPRCSVNTGNPATVTVSTSGPSAGMTSRTGAALSYAMWLPLLGLVGIGKGFGSRQSSKQRKIKAMLLSGVVFSAIVSQMACGGGSGSSGGNSGTPAGAYTITVTGTSSAATGSLVRSTSTTLQVQ